MSSSGALFGSSVGRGQSKHLVEFKAGKMNLKGTMVIPDKRKGLIYIYQSEDHLMHFCWKDRQRGNVEDDLLIFPDDIEYKHIPQCTTGRVYLLKFKSNNKKMFFWMQESKPDKDSELWSKLNDLLNHPPTPSRSGLLPPDLAATLAGEGTDINNLLGNMDPQQMMRLITGMGNMSSLLGSRSTSSMSSNDSNPSSRLSSTTTIRSTTDSASRATATPVTALESSRTSATATTAAADPTPVAVPAPAPVAATVVGAGAQQGKDEEGAKSFTPVIQLRDLQDILSNFNDQESSDRIEEIDLMRTITPEVLLPLLVDPKIQERLIPFLPEGESTPKTLEELKENVESPQFQQTLRGFCNALLSGQLGPLIGQFNLGQEAVEAANKGDVVAFAKALQKHCKKDDAQ